MDAVESENEEVQGDKDESSHLILFPIDILQDTVSPLHIVLEITLISET